MNGYKSPQNENVIIIPPNPEQVAELEREQEMIDRTSGIGYHFNQIDKIRKAYELRAQIEAYNNVIQYSQEQVAILSDKLQEIENEP